MAVQVTTLSCPNCGGPVSTGMKFCEYCGSEIMITSFQSVASMPLPMVGKRMQSYQKALASDPDNKELNTSAAMCFL